MPETFTSDRLEDKTTFADTHTEVLDKYIEVLSHSTNDLMGTTYGEGNSAIAQGTAAMMINGNWAISEMKKVNPDCNIDLFAFPSSNDESKNYVTSGVDVLLAVSSSSKYPEAAKAFIAFMVEAENAQAYIDNQFAFSAVKGVEQNDPTVAGVKSDIANGKVANFPDHYYPSGFDLASALSEFALNYTTGMNNEDNIKNTLSGIDELYDSVNVEQ
jgi:raffinose/stachyose/melibiose transport system substrate-binding protein